MFSAIILAAGRSQRMGTQKLLLPFGKSTIIERVVDAYLHAAVSTTIVVTRADDESVRRALGARPVIHVTNPEPESDMLGSLRCGVGALPSGTEAVLVSPGDQPSISQNLVKEVLGVFRCSDKGIVVPVYEGRRGHPLVFRARYAQEILSSFAGIGLRGLLEKHADDVQEWLTSDTAVIEDVDTPADYQKSKVGSTVLPAPKRDHPDPADTGPGYNRSGA